jgi:hypothetical protein
MTESTQSLQNLLGMLGHSAAGDQSAVLQKLENIQQQTIAAFASLDFLHEKVDALCAGMQEIRAEVASETLAPSSDVLHATALTQEALSATCLKENDQNVTTTPDFVTINVREDAPEEAFAACIPTPLPAVDSAATAATITTLTTLTTLAVPIPLEPEGNYTNSTDILNVLWPGLPKNDHNESFVDGIRQEAELVHEVD